MLFWEPRHTLEVSQREVKKLFLTFLMVVCCYFAEMLQNDVRGKKTEQPRNWRTLDGEYNRERTQTRTDVKKESNLENVSWIFGVEAGSTPQPPQNTQADTHTHTHTRTCTCTCTCLCLDKCTSQLVLQASDLHISQLKINAH